MNRRIADARRVHDAVDGDDDRQRRRRRRWRR